MDNDNFLQRLMRYILFLFVAFISYNVGKQSTITKVLIMIEDQQKVSKEPVVLEDLMVDVSKLR